MKNAWYQWPSVEGRGREGASRPVWQEARGNATPPSIDLTWPAPTRPGDRLHVELEVTDVRTSTSDPTRGFITTTYDTLNQHGDIRQHTTGRLLAFAKPR